jgi:hypothetical protein
MTESVRAVRASVQIGSLTVDGFMLPDGSYRMSQTKVAEAAGLSRRNVSDFFTFKRPEKLAGKGKSYSSHPPMAGCGMVVKWPTG